MPNQPATPTSTFRLPPELRAAAAAEAAERQVPITTVVIWALEARYPTVKWTPHKPPLRRRKRRRQPSPNSEELPIAANS